MRKKLFFLPFVIGILFSNTTIFASPYQLIYNESAFVAPHMNSDVTEDLIYTKGYINDVAMRTMFRMGLFYRLELSLAFSMNYFFDIQSPDDLYLAFYKKQGYDVDNIKLDNPRLSYWEPKLKVKLFTLYGKYHFVGYVKSKFFRGIPIIVQYPQDGRDKNAIAVTTPNAQQGTDVTAGIVGRVKLSDSPHTIPMLTFGLDHTYSWGKDWMEKRRTSHHMPAVVFAPELVFLRYWMIQLESRYEYWIGRGYHFEVIPGIRWEIQPKNVLQLGIGLPEGGGQVTRIFFGFSYEFGTSGLK